MTDLPARLRAAGLPECVEYADVHDAPVGGDWNDAAVYEKGFRAALKYADACIAALLDVCEAKAEVNWSHGWRARAEQAEAEARKSDDRYRAERRLRQAADSALAQALRHPNSKLDHVAGYLYRLEHGGEG